MANGKEPPFFNKDKVESFHYKLPFYESMELFIETLTGTSFELRVSPFDTIISVKVKIQRLEGIPVTQQHLIWNNTELEDDYCLNDYSISEGCTLKLVLAMRGGPINTKRVPLDDSIREMAEYMEGSRDDFWEGTTSNKQVTLLVYREGDQLNFFRVVDRGDGTLTPLSETLSGGSAYNWLADEDEESKTCPSNQQIENSVTMDKMRRLKCKMENMNLSKKPKKCGKAKPRPPMAPRSSCTSVTSVRNRIFRVLPGIGQSLNSPCLPVVEQHTSDSSHHALLSLASLTVAGSLAPSSNIASTVDEGTCNSVVYAAEDGIMLPPEVSSIPLENHSLQKNKACFQEMVAASESPVLESQEITFCHRAVNSELDLLMKKSETQRSENVVSLCEDPNKNDSSNGADGKRSTFVELGQSVKELACNDAVCAMLSDSLSSESMETGDSSNSEVSFKNGGVSSPISSVQVPHSPTIKSQKSTKTSTISTLRPSTSYNLLHSTDMGSLPDVGRTSVFRGVKVASPGRRSDIISKLEARDITERANKATKEPLAMMSNFGILTSLVRSANTNLHGYYGTGRLRTTGVVLPSNFQHSQEAALRRTSPSYRAQEVFISPHCQGQTGSNSCTGKRVGSPTLYFPPVKTPAQVKKKHTKHCFLCGKKTGLTTGYECRCGNNFCAVHRYAETHDCTFDYKAAGRKYLQEANPVISAPKLPKI
ncbi:AN1-type zinc finger protein 4 [Protopterus annectens]|uniref:AN1-type zinc finger protein 4 n=1 Tax=Protopterus annectens TaxID=7888 RepID=UPI001CF9A43D|nr:AN1-type zinc finger protein 4 [Protopterus annectens]